MSSFCGKCGAQIGDGVLFCPQCGSRLEESMSIVFCSKCGEQVSPGSKFCGNCGMPVGDTSDATIPNDAGGAQLSSSNQLEPGTKLKNGRYTLIKVLGQGGFGITYLANDRDTNTMVCIKELFIGEKCSRDVNSRVIVSSSMSADMQIFRNRFRKECENLASLSHKNIVKILDRFDDNDTSYFVMEYVNGESLNGISALPEAEALTIIRELCDAMMYVHGKQINHLDIKPGNVVRRKSDGHIFLIDFGVSKNYDPTKSGNKTSTSTVIGMSEGFCPIEQSNHGIKGFSPESDVYAIGATLYCLLVGKRPPNASDILNDGFDDSELLAKHVSVDTIHAIREAMRPARKQRTKSVTSFLENLPKNNVEDFNEFSARFFQAERLYELKEYDEAFQIYYELAKEGHGPSIDRLYSMFLDDPAVTLKNNKETEYWFRSAVADLYVDTAKMLHKRIFKKVDPPANYTNKYRVLAILCWLVGSILSFYMFPMIGNFNWIIYALALIFMFKDFKHNGQPDSESQKSKLSYHLPMLLMMLGVFMQFWEMYSCFYWWHFASDVFRWHCDKGDYIYAVVHSVSSWAAQVFLLFSLYKLFKEEYVSAVFLIVPFASNCLSAYVIHGRPLFIAGILFSLIGFRIYKRRNRLNSYRA